MSLLPLNAENKKKVTGAESLHCGVQALRHSLGRCLEGAGQRFSQSHPFGHKFLR